MSERSSTRRGADTGEPVEAEAGSAAGESSPTGEGRACADPELLSEAAPAVSARGPRASRPDWRRLFTGGTAREVLARLVEGDPLGLRVVVAERIQRGCYLLDADRLHLRGLARCARSAPQYRGRPPLDEWLGQVVDDALLDILREDAEGERAELAPTPEQLAAYHELARPLGLDPERMRGVCVVFNGLPADERGPFHALVIDGGSLDELARETGRSATELARAARRVFETLLAGVGDTDARRGR